MSDKVSCLLDTNVILECYQTGLWRALAGGYQVDTVEDCVTETQTGFQLRQPERQIDELALRVSLAAVHVVGDQESAKLTVRIPGIALDRGEASLWAHAFHRDDAWLLCGPDKASLRFGILLGFRKRLVSLERLFDDIGYRPASKLRAAYTRNWHKRTVGQLILTEGGRL